MSADYELVMVPSALVDRVRSSTAHNAPDAWLRDLWDVTAKQVTPPLRPGDQVRSAKTGNDVVGMRDGVPWRITAIDQHGIALLRAEHPSLSDGVQYAHAPVGVLERWQP